MSRLKFMQFCDNAFLDQRGKLNMIGIFDTIWAEKFPTVHPRFSVVTKVETSPGKHVFKIVFGHSGKDLMTVEGETNSEGPNQQFIGDVIQFQFPEEGVYSITVFVDGDLLGKGSIELKLVPSRGRRV